MRPAIRIIFAPLFKRLKAVREEDSYLHGQAQGRTIWIDPRSQYVLDTLIHEVAHVEHPSWTEQEVRSYTKKRLTKMGWKEKARWLRLLGSAKIEGEE